MINKYIALNDLEPADEQAITMGVKEESDKAYAMGRRRGAVESIALSFSMIFVFGLLSGFGFFGGMLASTIVFGLIALWFYFFV